jgi:hypothetical protein
MSIYIILEISVFITLVPDVLFILPFNGFEIRTLFTHPYGMLSQPTSSPSQPSEPTTLRRIEFVGDSDSNGFGVLGPVCRCGHLGTLPGQSL